MGWLAPRPGRFTPGKETRYPFYSRLGGPQGRSGRLRKISPPPGFDPPTVQPVASHYTDWAIPARHVTSTYIYDSPHIDSRLESSNIPSVATVKTESLNNGMLFYTVPKQYVNKTCIISKIYYHTSPPAPVSARSKAWVCGCSSARIAGPNPEGSMNVCLLWVLYVRSLGRADHSSRGVLPNVMCLSVIVKTR
jgi:hypothetical protein